MKRAIASFFILLSVLMFFTGCVTRPGKSESIILHFHHHSGIDIDCELTGDEASDIRKMLSGKFLNLDSGVSSCGFSESVSIEIGGNLYCPACDGCTSVYDANKKRYFEITAEERARLEEIFENHGGGFPCV